MARAWWLQPGKEASRCEAVKPDGRQCKGPAHAEGESLCRIHAKLAVARQEEDPAGWSRPRLEQEVLRLRAALAACGRAGCPSAASEGAPK